MKPSPRLAAVLFLLFACAPAFGEEGGPAAPPPGGLFAPSALEELDGSPGSPVLTAPRWRQALHDAGRLAGEAGALPDAARVREAAARRAKSGLVPIGLLDLSVPSGDGAGAIGIFAAAALKEHTYRGEEARFVLDAERLFSGGPVGARLEIDPDDGGGFRALPIGEPVGARYGSAGEKTVRVRAIDPDGSERISSFRFDVRALAAPLPDDTLAIAATVPYLGQYGAGEAYVYLSDSHATLTNPAVVIEGFDLDDTMNWEELYALLNQQNLVETLRDEGFDAVVLNFDQATDYMQRNSFVVVALIEQVLASIEPDREIVLIGASMGGIVSRYALTWMESQSIDHRVRTFISFDAPQRGAAIPLGVQYWLDFFSDLSTDAAFLLSRLDTPAARQLLVYHHTSPPGSTGEPDSLRPAFDAELASIGGWPALPRKVAVANGSGVGAGQGFAAGAQIIDYEYDGLLVDIRGNVWAVPDGGAATILDGYIRIWPFSATTMLVSVSGTEPYDNAPGGRRSSMAEMDATEAPYGDIVALHPSHCFIPTTSALALETSDLFYPVLSDTNAILLTPFDAIYCPAENQDHVSITPESAVWFLEEITRPATAVVEAGGEAPARPALLPNSPNPFNPRTTIRFDLAEEAFTSLRVYDSAGRLAAVLVDGELPAGRHEAMFRADGLPSGVYFCRLTAGSVVLAEKMTLVR